jgi:hypothetical protein
LFPRIVAFQTLIKVLYTIYEFIFFLLHKLKLTVDSVYSLWVI